MKLALIINVWDDFYILRETLKTLRPLVDGVIIVASTYSNYKEYSPIPEDFKNDELFVREPKFHVPLHSETDKRNYGLQIAKEKGYTHFLTADADELYKPDEFLKAKEYILKKDLNGLVCPTVVYFGSPTLSLGRDITLVPFIHKLTPGIKHEFNRSYPLAWISGQIRIDPSRSLNINSGVEYSNDIECHHLSWCRRDYPKKIRNSTARKNLERSNILKQLVYPKAGDFIDFYKKLLVPATVDFNIDGKIFDSPIHQGIQLHST